MKGFTLEQIQLYINGKADARLTAGIEEARKNDLQLEEQIKFMQEMGLAYETKELSDVLDSISQKDQGQKKEASSATTKKFPIKWLLSAAAGILLLITVWFFSGKETASTPLAFDKYMAPPTALATPMGQSDQYAFMDAMVDYKTKKYELALEKWKKLSAIQQSDTLQFYMGGAEFALNNLPAAKINFQKIATDANSHFNDQSNWYLAIIAVQQKEFSLAKRYLQNTDHPLKPYLLKQLP